MLEWMTTVSSFELRSGLGGTRAGVRLGSLVYQQIKERLLEGTYVAGERLQVEALKTQFQVSKQPVMEALRRLADEGLVDIIPQVGCAVSRYPQREVTDFFRFFAGMEGVLVEIAVGRSTETQLRRLDQVETQIATLRGETDPKRRSHGYRVHNREFHAIVHEMAGSGIMAVTCERMFDLSDFLINTHGVGTPLSDALDERHADHERIIEALRMGDSVAARSAMEAHIERTSEIIRLDTRAALDGEIDAANAG
jgi:DNA-binding GntR family transcriptional regulator